ncbi:MAG TPA: hypothetical protein VG603_02915, partial [Chitinophagales bacterium]|nr:hypothetical protein [Chitinophagales bacterium]
MKIALPFAALFFTVSLLNGQITVTQNDFANAGDTVRMSTAVVDYFLNYSNNGPNTSWDFSSLQMSDQNVDKFQDALTASYYYSLYFSNTGLNSHRSNIAVQQPNPSVNIPLVTVTDVYNYYYKTSSKYEQMGIGEKINGLPTPVGFSSPDVLYRFPLNYGDADTSSSGYQVSLPTLGYFGYHQTRINHVDGWGAVTTPFGSFDALR